MSLSDNEREYLQKLIRMKEYQIKEERELHEKQMGKFVKGTLLILCIVIVFSFCAVYRAERVREYRIQNIIIETLNNYLCERFPE